MLCSSNQRRPLQILKWGPDAVVVHKCLYIEKIIVKWDIGKPFFLTAKKCDDIRELQSIGLSSASSSVGVAYVKKWAQAFFAILVVIESKAVAAAKAKASQWAFATVVAWSFFFFCGGVQLFMWLVAKKSSDEFSAATVSLKASTIAVLEELKKQ